ncbi:hypothetical protein [Methanobacterium sp.]|uniref:hypothetical protein n=2 Tax=Methanobacterium sp. TaxID=2164 RepID=UPI003C78C39A
MKTRPKGVLLIAIIVFIAALLALIVGITIFVPGTPLDMIWTLKNSFPTGFKSSSTGIIFGYFIVILGLILISAVWGLLKGMKWAWWVVLIVFLINGIGDVISVIFGGGINGISGIIIISAFIIYLTRPNIKKYFEKNIV